MKRDIVKVRQTIYCTVALLFFETIPEHTNALVLPWHQFKKSRRCRNVALAFVTMHEQPYPLPHCCGIGNLHVTHRFL